MNAQATSPGTWIVCEQGDRWQRVLHEIAARERVKHSNPDVAAANWWRHGTIAEARALAVQQSPLIILWEIPLQQIDETLRGIRLSARLSRPPLQIAALPSQLERSPLLDSLRWSLRQLGAAIVIHHPEEFAVAYRLATRFTSQQFAPQ